MKDIKTPEEILKSVGVDFYCDNWQRSEESKNEVLEAMNEYADQFMLSTPKKDLVAGGEEEGMIQKHLNKIKELGFYYELVHLLQLQREECLKSIMNTDFYRKYKYDFPKSYITEASTPEDLEKWKSFKPETKNQSTMNNKQEAVEESMFELKDIEDARIIIKAKGKHWSILPKDREKKEECKLYRIALVMALLSEGDHVVVSTPLEDLKNKI